jgi:hypothetical protein
MSQHATVPQCFVWTRFGTEAGQSISDILRRKEQERSANGGLFYWGIGNAVGPSILELLRKSDEPEVLFSPIKSTPRRDDVAPETVVAWTAAAGLNGEPHPLPTSSLITSRFNIGRPRHYALVCSSDSSLEDDFDAAATNAERIAVSQLANIVTGRPLGASQVTAVVKRQAQQGLSSTEYTVKFRAKLVPPYFIQLSTPQQIKDGGRISLGQSVVWKDTDNSSAT